MNDHSHEEEQTPLATAEEVAEVKTLISLAIELLCPKCAPAAIVRMHPELGPQSVKPSLTGDAPESDPA